MMEEQEEISFDFGAPLMFGAQEIAATGVAAAWTLRSLHKELSAGDLASWDQKQTESSSFDSLTTTIPSDLSNSPTGVATVSTPCMPMMSKSWGPSEEVSYRNGSENAKAEELEDPLIGSLEELEKSFGKLLPEEEEGEFSKQDTSSMFANLFGQEQFNLWLSQATSSNFLKQGNDNDDDVFGSGAGLELNFNQKSAPRLFADTLHAGIDTDFQQQQGDHAFRSLNSIACANLAAIQNQYGGEHPLGEHPSRTLFVRNINSNVEEEELRQIFSSFGDIRSMYTACKHRGFVMISYYDIRSSRAAMRTLQGHLLRRRKLDIHYSIPKENPSDRDVNQGTLVVFNLDPSVSNEQLRQLFSTCGEVREIRETPHKKHHKFVEYFDVRDAQNALRILNRAEIAGKRIKIEPSRPGGARKPAPFTPEMAGLEEMLQTYKPDRKSVV